MNAEIICVGTEILLGDIINTNGSFIAKELARIGVDIYHQTVVGDNIDRLSESLKLAFNRADMVITTGGLVPTYDDMTKDTIAKYFGRELIHDKKAINNIKSLFKDLKRTMTENNLRQALVIEGSTVLDNDHGLAPGIFLADKGKTVVMLPGPPHEMQPMFLNKLLPLLAKESNSALVSKNVHIFNVGESTVEHTLRDMMINSKNPTIAPYANHGEMYVRITAKAKNKKEGLKIVDPVVKKIKDIFKENVYGIDSKNLQSELVKRLIEENKSIAVAESCTGGIIASRITQVPGSSAVFGYGTVTYANEAKTSLLGVSEETLIKYGAVSEETAAMMAEGIMKLGKADIGIGITGIAGPTGGTEEKPVGLVYVGIATKKGTEVKKLNLSRGRKDEREGIRQYAASNALFLALTTLNKI